MIPRYKIPVTIMRGGTSKGVFFWEPDLPASGADRDAVILNVMGSPDPRQIDGLGGADPLTSKVAIIAPPSVAETDVTYTFAQIGIDEAYVRYTGNCGNISAAVGVYAIQNGLVDAVSPVTPVRIYNTNTDKVLIAHVPVADGMALETGDFEIAGVPGTGAEIRLDFASMAGATTGRLLPTGNRRDRLFVPSLGRDIDISIVDAAKATLFFHAREVGLDGTEGPEEFTSELLRRCWDVHEAAAKLIGLDAKGGHLPTPVPVAPPADYTNYSTGTTVSADSVSFVARRVIGPPPRLHKAFAGTGGVATGVAAVLEGTIVNEVAQLSDDGVVRLGHPTGVMPLYVRLDGESILEASVSRTARRILDGHVNVRQS